MTESDRDKTLQVMARAMGAPVEGPEGEKWGEYPPFNRFARLALDALEASGRAVVAGWRPIESAPKDGTRIILAWGGKSVTGSYLDNGHTDYPWKGWRVPSLELTPPGAPISWMPFPEVPAHDS